MRHPRSRQGDTLRAFLKRILRGFGYNISRYERRRSFVGALECLQANGFRPETIIDVGVGYGTPDLYQTFPRARYLLIEPLDEFGPVLRDLSAHYQAEYILAAASNVTDIATIHVRDGALETSSLGRWVGLHTGHQARRVPTVRLDSLCADRRLPGPFLIKADVQGSELAVIDGATGILAETEVIILEISLFQFHNELPQLADVVAAMRARGFVIYDIVGGYYRPLDGALGQIDAFFVKETG